MFLEKSIAELHNGLEKRTIDPVDMAWSCIYTIEKFEDQYRACVCFNRDALLQQAVECRKRLEHGGGIRPLEGVPVAVKDIINTFDFPTQMGSPLWQGFTPGNDARIVYYIRNAGGVIPGKTVTAEFAVHTLNETLNPHDISRTPGTSSSGSAVAVALGMMPVALGTQTAGSIVRPASFCGVYGCKPSFGLIPRTGMLKTSDSLDTVGFFAAHHCDLQKVFEVIRVHGPNFPISKKAFQDVARQNKQTGRPWRVGLARTHTWEHAYEYAKDALLTWAQQLAQNVNIEIRDAELPEDMVRAHQIHAKIYSKTLSYYFKEEYKKSELVSPIMNDLIMQGLKIPVSDYHRALNEQTRLIHAMDNFFKDFDVIVSLSSAGEAPLRNEAERPDPALMWTLTHLPVISAPCFVSPRGLPFGVQLVARKYNDYLLFRFSEYLESLELLPAATKPYVKDIG